MRLFRCYCRQAVLLITSATILLTISSVGSRKQWTDEADKDNRPATLPSLPPTIGPTRAPVVRNSREPTRGAEASTMDVLVLTEDVLEQTSPGSEVWLASAWRDDQFRPADLTLLRAIMTWLRTVNGHCDQLQMMGAPRRSGNGRRPELAVCGDQAAAPDARRSPCLVYQLGFNRDWTLAEQMARNGCQVFVLDHREQAEPEGEHSFNVQFRRLGVGRNAHVSSGGQVLTLDGLMRELGHQQRQLYLLRADLNGLETDMLLDQLVDRKSRYNRRFVLDRVQQLSLRLHLRRHVELELPFYRALGRALQQLGALGFRLVHSAPFEASGRWLFPGQSTTTALIHDVLLVKLQAPARGFSVNMVW